MKITAHPPTPLGAPSRRQLLSGIIIATGTFAAGTRVRAEATAPSAKESPDKAENQKRTALRQEIDLPASPRRVYETLLDSKQFAAFTGLPAEIDSKPGEAFSVFGGMIVGRNIELVPHERIVQAWRPAHWDPGIYSIVKFEMKSQGSGTKLVLDHSSFPEGDFDSLSAGWKKRYWDPLEKYFARG